MGPVGSADAASARDPLSARGVGEAHKQIAVTGERGAEADEIATAKRVERAKQRVLIHRACGLNLLLATIILWNSPSLEQASTKVGAPDEVARHIAPLRCEHISLTGDDSSERNDRPGPD